MAGDPEVHQDEIFDLGLIAREESSGDAGRSPSADPRASFVWSAQRGRRCLIGLGVCLMVLAVLRVGAAVGPGDEQRAMNPITADPTLVASVDPAIRVGPESVETSRARAELAGNVGVAMSFCNGMAKHFDETPLQVERARRYADCLDGFELEMRLPTSTLHHGYGISPDLEPAVVLQCGSVLTGPDVSPAAMADFERCAGEAEVMFGLDDAS